MPLLQVALPVPLDRCFDYRHEGETPAIGCRVRVPFGQRELIGIVAGIAADRDGEFKSIIEVLDKAPLFDPVLWQTFERAARYYHAPLGDLIATAMPAGLRRAQAIDVQREVLVNLIDRTAPGPARGERAKAIWARLLAGPASGAELAAIHAPWRAVVRRWIEKRWVSLSEMSPYMPPPILAPPPPLSEAQLEAVRALRSAHGFTVHLLDGVTGSGKTEVYLQRLADIVAAGRQGLLLVPEIGLTPQLLARVRERLPARVAALHSSLGDGERAAAYAAAARGEVDVVVGTRSAVWTPLPNLGLIVVDEEHDASFKQQDGIRYHARDVALLRAQGANAPVLLGSATPSFESLHNVDSGKFMRLELPQRVGTAKPPTWTTVDLRLKTLRDGFAPETLLHIRRHLDMGGQVLVFKNRRGYSPAMLCHDCGWHGRCEACEHALTWHRGEGVLRCHSCGFQQRAPRSCPECHGLALMPQGSGTERLEAALAEHFPATPMVRLDRDTTAHKNAFENAITTVLKGEPMLIVGTQMLAKGHHLPDVSLVVVAGVDEHLMSPDFRAAEHLAQLLVQVAGRAGRAARPGEVLLQTHVPQHPTLTTLIERGYGAYAQAALAERKQAELPPCVFAAVLRSEHRDAKIAEQFLSSLVEPRHDGVSIAGPLPAPQPKRQDRFRFQLILMAAQRGALHAALKARTIRMRASKIKVRYSIDVDPLDFS